MTDWFNDPEPIHLWFGLTYSNYLVMPRSVLQSMPQPWQARFCSLLSETQEAFGHLDWPSYDVRALVREREVVQLPCEDCDGEGVIDEIETPCEWCEGSGMAEERRYETSEEVGLRTDPIPHYNGGRTRLEPLGDDVRRSTPKEDE